MSTKPVAHQVVPGAGGAESAAAEEGAVRPRDSLFHWCGTADAIRTTTTRPDKRAILDAYFAVVAEETVAPAARFFAGAFFPRTDAGTRWIEAAIVADAIRDLAQVALDRLRGRRKKLRDIASVAADVFAGRLPSGIAMSEVAAWADDLAAATEANAQRRLVGEMLARLSSLEARYVVQLVVGELDIGLDPADVEGALAARQASSEGVRSPDRRRNKRPA
jgi:DNA ligase-1